MRGGGEWEGLRRCGREGTNWISHAQEVKTPNRPRTWLEPVSRGQATTSGDSGKGRRADSGRRCVLRGPASAVGARGARPAGGRDSLAVTLLFPVS